MTDPLTQRMTRHEVIVAEPGGGWIRPEGESNEGIDGGREWKNWGRTKGREGRGIVWRRGYEKRTVFVRGRCLFNFVGLTAGRLPERALIQG